MKDKFVISEYDKDFEPIFDAFKETDRYKELGFSKKHIKYTLFGKQEYNALTQEDLNAIENLTIKFNANIDISKIVDNIETLLPNLKSLKINTFNETTMKGLLFDAVNEYMFSYQSTIEKNNILYTIFSVNKLNESQMRHIEKLTKLEYLNIPNQSFIKSIDVSNMPNLKVLLAKDCERLKTIEGIDFNNFFKCIYSQFDFTGCENLSSDCLEKFAQKFDVKQFEDKEIVPGQLAYTAGHMFLPLNTMLRREIKSAQNFVDFTEKYQKDAVMFSTSTPGLLLNHYAKDVEIFRDKLDRIISKSFSNDVSDMKKIITLYKWVVRNITYDFKTKDREEKDFESIIRTDDVFREASHNISEKTRSAVYTLKRNNGMCVGIADLFSCLVYRAGITRQIRKVSCSTEIPKFDGELIRPNHQILCIKIKDCGDYYFDPTNDLYNRFLKNFALNKEEISKKVTLSYRENLVQNAQTLHRIKIEDDKALW